MLELLKTASEIADCPADLIRGIADYAEAYDAAPKPDTAGRLLYCILRQIAALGPNNAISICNAYVPGWNGLPHGLVRESARVGVLAIVSDIVCRMVPRLDFDNPACVLLVQAGYVQLFIAAISKLAEDHYPHTLTELLRKEVARNAIQFRN